MDRIEQWKTDNRTAALAHKKTYRERDARRRGLLRSEAAAFIETSGGTRT